MYRDGCFTILLKNKTVEGRFVQLHVRNIWGRVFDIMTDDESWLYKYKPESKCQWKVWVFEIEDWSNESWYGKRRWYLQLFMQSSMRKLSLWNSEDCNCKAILIFVSEKCDHQKNWRKKRICVVFHYIVIMLSIVQPAELWISYTILL